MGLRDGSGQAAIPLAGHFERVVATDISARQIEAAARHPGVEYRAAPAEASGLPDAGVDLIAVAQALHWLDLPVFYEEVRRVGRPGAFIAAWTYGAPRFDREPLDLALQHFYEQIVGPYWPVERRLVETAYRTLDFPFREIEVPRFEMAADWSFAHLKEYLGSWSATARFRTERGFDPVEVYSPDLEAAWGTASQRRIEWPLTLRAGPVHSE